MISEAVQFISQLFRVFLEMIDFTYTDVDQGFYVRDSVLNFYPTWRERS